jgi:hypothetical protein
MRNAFIEGYGNKNGVSVVIGIPREAIPDAIKLDDSVPTFYGLERSLVRSIRGSVMPEQIPLVIVRIPMRAFPEEFMTESEKERSHSTDKNEFIIRGYIRKLQEKTHPV